MPNLRRYTGGFSCEVRFTNGVARLKEGWYSIGARGQVCVVEGKAFVTLASSGETTEVPPGRVFFSEFGFFGSVNDYGVYDRPLLLQ
jgi:hypothetical protein